MVSRRRLLTRSGAAAAAWSMFGQRMPSARAAGSGAPLRLILWPSLNGATPPYFWPNPGNLAAMSPITEPLAPYQKQITFVRGVDVAGSTNHMAVRSIFTGFPIADYASPDPNVKSLDQVVADHFAATAPSPLKSLHLGAIPADSLELYQLYGRSTFFFSPRPVDYEANPVTAYDRVFKGMGAAPPPVVGTPGSTPPPAASFDSEVLDLVDAELAEIGTRLAGSVERSKIEQHRSALKRLRPAAGATGGGGGQIVLPGTCGSGGPLDSVEKLRASLMGNPRAAYKHQYYSDIFDAQVDIMTRAIVCGLTRVATLQAGSADGNVTDPVGPGYPHHNTSHGSQAVFAQCQNWYATKFLRLLKGLDVPDPLDPSGKTVLYNSVIVWMAECLPIGHESISVPMFVAGNAGGAMKAGGYLPLAGATNKAVLQTVLQLMGVPMAAHFGGQTIGELRA